METTNNSVTVKKILPLGTQTFYVLTRLSLDVTFQGVVTRYNCTSVTNAAHDAVGEIVFSTVDLPSIGNYNLRVVSESTDDQDTNKVVVTPIGSSSIRKVQNTTTVEIL
jgi:hypothetical protein